LVFFIGLVGYDFGTEARRDTFKQQMPPVWYRNVAGRDEFRYTEGLSDDEVQALARDGFQGVPPNPYDPRQMVAYLKYRPDEASSLIWTLNLELTAVYSVTPVGPFANRVYDILVSMLDGQSQSVESANYVERVSVPAVLSGHSVRLFSGQEVSQLWVDAPRGMYSWRTTDLLTRASPAIAAAIAGAPDPERDTPQQILRMVLNKIYYEYRNLGVTSPDRALNFAATNIFTLTGVLAEAVAKGKELDSIDVIKSPYGRVDSDCWDVQLKFMDPENTNRAYTVFRFTIDVSDKLPVSMGNIVSYTKAAR
jgi:cyanobactin maturation PatA/PatG family protease